MQNSNMENVRVRRGSVVQREGGAGHLTVGLVYRTPSAIAEDVLHSIRRWTAGGRCVLLGDFNAPNINFEAGVWGYHDGTFEYQLYELLESLSLYQHIQDLSRIQVSSASVLDLVLSPRRSDVVDIVRPDPFGSSDHVAIVIYWRINFHIVKDAQERPNVWNKQYEELRATAQCLQWPTNEDIDDDVETRWAQFKNNIINLVSMSAPPRCTSAKRWNRAAFEDSLAATAATAPKRLFAYLRRGTEFPTTLPPLLDQGMPKDDPGEQADIFARHYASVYES
ncbi:unnamed protein product [Echinostoma caproni]|uniref:Endo/exonuclease/phosphatase domain-containing protein n=1 Tax=Echinostoma caproni TaxID=27848 RepID=A0A183BDL9_9TREM|nr:unnamed protein product [Echinostoma caproni]